MLCVLEGAKMLLMAATMVALEEAASVQFTDLAYFVGVRAMCANLK